MTRLVSVTGDEMRSITRTADWGRTARAYAMAALVLGLIWAGLASLLV